MRGDRGETIALCFHKFNALGGGMAVHFQHHDGNGHAAQCNAQRQKFENGLWFVGIQASEGG